jgi:4'-phosphopantetheinyl transferase
VSHRFEAGRLELLLLDAATAEEAERAADDPRVEWLSEAERARMQRFHFARHRAEFLRGKLLTRATLAARVGEGPAALRFASASHGKPSLLGTQRVAFNLSHSGGTNLLAVSSHGEVGVDIEHIDAQRCGVDLARRYFTPGECQYLLHAPQHELALRFFSLWTLKEALIKAHGGGLSVGLDRFAVVVSCGALRFGFSPELAAQLRPCGRYWHSGLAKLPGNMLAAWFVLCDKPGQLAVQCQTLALPVNGAPSTASTQVQILATGAGALPVVCEEVAVGECAA